MLSFVLIFIPLFKERVDSYMVLHRLRKQKCLICEVKSVKTHQRTFTVETSSLFYKEIIYLCRKRNVLQGNYMSLERD